LQQSIGRVRLDLPSIHLWVPENLPLGFRKIWPPLHVAAHYSFTDPIAFGEPMPKTTQVGRIHFFVDRDEIPAIAFGEAAFDLHVFAK
jgi:hypothetical protein